MKYTFKGIVRGSFSEYQADGLEDEVPVVEIFLSDSLHDLIAGLAIDEWIFVLKVNGRRVKNPYAYIKRQGLDPYNYIRAAADAEWLTAQAVKAI